MDDGHAAVLTIEMITYRCPRFFGPPDL